MIDELFYLPITGAVDHTDCNCIIPMEDPLLIWGLTYQALALAEALQGFDPSCRLLLRKRK